MDELFKDLDRFAEDKGTSALIKRLDKAKLRGYLTKDEFIAIGMWKSARQKNRYLSNSEADIKEITRYALSCDNEKIKPLTLTALNGVSIPVASAILTLVDPENYGVIDIRVWKTLHKYGLVKNNASGQGITLTDWINFLSIIRALARKYDCSARTIEQVMFRHHKDVLQSGTLYSSSSVA